MIKVKIPKDRDGKQKQFAFVNFKHEESVPYGMSLLNGIKLYGRPIKIQFRSGTQEKKHKITQLPGGKQSGRLPPPPQTRQRCTELVSDGCCSPFSSNCPSPASRRRYRTVLSHRHVLLPLGFDQGPTCHFRGHINPGLSLPFCSIIRSVPLKAPLNYTSCESCC